MAPGSAAPMEQDQFGGMMRCVAVLACGERCGREAAGEDELCARHRSVAARRAMRPFQLARLSAEDREALPAAEEMKGLDAEIAVLRLLIRRALSSDLEAARRGIESLVRALRTQQELEALAREGAGPGLEEVLERLAAEAEDEGPDPVKAGGVTAASPPSLTLPLKGGGDQFWPAARPAAHTVVGEGQTRGTRGEARGMSGPHPASSFDFAQDRPTAAGEGRIVAEGQGGLEAEAAALVLRHQVGEPEAIVLLQGLLKPAIVGVLLNELAFQPAAELSLEELEAESGRVLDELARRWRPGVSFLGYLMRTFPSAMARYAREGGRGPDPSPLPPRWERGPEGARDGGSDAAVAGAADRGWEGPYSAEGLASLPELERQILVLRDLEGQSMRGIARRVGVAEMAAYKLYERARQRLGGKIGSLEGGEWAALRRLVEALHAAAGARGRLPGRGWTMAAAGLKRIEYDRLIGRLEAAGAIEGRRGRQKPGRLVERNAAATLARVGWGRRSDRPLRKSEQPWC